MEGLVNVIYVDIALDMSGCVGKTKGDRPSHMGRLALKDSIFSPPFNNSFFVSLAGPT